MTRSIILTALLLFPALAGFGQMYPERGAIRSGNRAYDKGDYEASEVHYLDALKKHPGSFEGAFNLAGSHYKQERYEEAQARLEQLIAHPEASPREIARAYYNLGNALFRQDKLEEALEAYKNSMRIDPDDPEAKFNYAYTKKLLEQDENDDPDDGDGEGDGGEGGEGGSDDPDDPDGDDKNDDEGDNDDPDNNGDGGDDDDSDNDGDQDKDNDRDRPDSPQPDSGGMSREEAERMLDAMQNSEDRTRDRLDEEKAAAVSAPSGKNW